MHYPDASLGRIALAAPLLTVLLAIGGCRDEPRLDNLTAVTLSDPAKRHPIQYSRRTETLYVEVASDGLGLSENQVNDVYRFIDRYRSEANGHLRITAPGTVRGHFAVSRSFRDIEELVDRAGIPEQAIDRHRTSGKSAYGPAVKLSYERSVAMAPHCGSWPEDMGRIDRERLPYENFGCAAQRNLAITVANARDLQVPQDETPRPSEKRSAGWSKYIGSGGTAASGGGGAAAGGGAKPLAK